MFCCLRSSRFLCSHKTMRSLWFGMEPVELYPVMRIYCLWGSQLDHRCISQLSSLLTLAPRPPLTRPLFPFPPTPTPPLALNPCCFKTWPPQTAPLLNLNDMIHSRRTVDRQLIRTRLYVNPINKWYNNDQSFEFSHNHLIWLSTKMVTFYSIFLVESS